ncbi:MAG: alpha/beta hydrolase [Gemmatimonadaceae bacterium]
MRTPLALAFLGITACVHPATVAPPEARPVAPALTYQESISRIAMRQIADDSVVARGGRSILMTHGAQAPRVIVLLHGFTDAPVQFEVLGKRFFAGGDNVYIPRLPHHAERVAPVRSLGKVRATELTDFGDAIIDEARGLGDTIIVAGLSAGGAIAGHIAQTRREVRRVVLIAPAIGPGRINDDESRALIVLAARLPEITRTEKPDSIQPDLIQGLTTHGLAEVLRLGQLVRDKAERGSPGASEIVFLLNELDQTVSEAASMALAQSWFDHDATVTVYRFGKALKLPHNLMAVAEHGGNLEIVLPVVEALVRSSAPPEAAELQPEPCGGLLCTLRRNFRR